MMVRARFQKVNETVFIPPKDWIQLFRDVIISVSDFILAKPENNVRVCFPIRVSWVQVRCLQKRNRKIFLDLFLCIFDVYLNIQMYKIRCSNILKHPLTYFFLGTC